MIDILQFINRNGDYVLIGAIFVVVLILFIREFDLTSRRSWAMLLGLSALGGVMLYKMIKRNRLLEDMKKREEALKDLEKEYEKLKEQHEITQENYEKARERLEEAKKQMVKDIIEADKAHQERLKEIEKEFENKSADDLMRMTEELLGK
jgi:F0F1-type ATP synthase membrane subunit b/b'